MADNSAHGLVARLKSLFNLHLLITVLAVLLLLLLVDHQLNYPFALLGVALFVVAAYLLPLVPENQPLEETKAAPPLPYDEKPLLRKLVKGLPDATIITDADESVIAYNNRASSFYSLLQTGQKISACIRYPNFLEAINKAKATEELQTVYVNQRVPVERRIEASIAAFDSDDDRCEGEKTTYLSITLRDLSEQESLARMRADFIANASHELRTPLSSLQGFIETLQGPARGDAEARDRFLNIMAEQSQRMARLIEDLLSLSRVEMKVHLMPEEDVEMGELLHHVIDTLEPIADKHGARLHFMRPRTPYYVRGDHDELVQLFQNLVQNAIKYGKDEGNVHIRLKTTKTGTGGAVRLRISVEDDGPGISAEHQPRLVERFYRVNVADSRQKQGTGLGLAIVKHILNRHQGDLNIVSKPGKGARFDVTLALERKSQETGAD